MKTIARSAIVEHAAAEMYALVNDVESYPRFLPWCLEVRVQQSGARKQATMTVGVSGIRQTLTTEYENQADRAIDMRLVEGPFSQFSAAWRFTPLGEHACQIEYSMRYQFASRALARLLEPLFNQIADTMVDAFTRRADERHR